MTKTAMSAEAFSSIPPQLPVELIDLVETKTPQANRAFIARVTQLAEEVGGRRVLANEVLLPMIVSDERASKSDQATRLLVITWYPTTQACQIALAKRKGWAPELLTESIRTYAAQHVGRIESLVGRTLPFTLGLLGRKPVPKIDDARKLETLIDDALILGEQPDKARWTELAARAGDRPIWMLNFLEFAETAVYGDDAQDVAPSTKISGASAYERYGRGMVGSLAAVGGRVGWSGHPIGPLPGTDDGQWHQLAIAVYPSPAAMLTMLALPKYRAAHVHRAAGLARTRLLATQPIADL